jgi:hypothetical protein
MAIRASASNDLLMSLQTSAQFTKDVTGGTEWVYVLILPAIYIAIGSVLIKLSLGPKTN